MHGSRSLASSSSTTSVRRGVRIGDGVADRRPRPPHGAARPEPALGPHHGVDAAALGAQRLAVQQVDEHGLVVVSPLERHVVVQVDRAGPLDHDLQGAADRAQPLPQDLGVGYRRREADERHVGRREDEHLLPDPAAVGVLEEVDLVEHDDAEPVQLRRAGEQHVAQHLGRHHDDRGAGPDRDVPGQQADRALAVLLAEVGELLVRERLERRRVEGLAVRGARAVHAVPGDDRLARSRRRAHEHRRAAVEGVEGADLEPVEREPDRGEERVADRLVRHLCSIFPTPIARK